MAAGRPEAAGTQPLARQLVGGLALVIAMLLLAGCAGATPTALPTPSPSPATLPAATSTPERPAATVPPVPTASATPARPTATSGPAREPDPTPTPTPSPTASPTPDIPAPTTPPPDRLTEIASFSLESLTVPVGTRVVWTNRDRAPHTITSGVAPVKDELWDSGAVAPESGFTFVFRQPGQFPYFCQLHPFMTGTVTVTP